MTLLLLLLLLFTPRGGETEHDRGGLLIPAGDRLTRGEKLSPKNSSKNDINHRFTTQRVFHIFRRDRLARREKLSPGTHRKTRSSFTTHKKDIFIFPKCVYRLLSTKQQNSKSCLDQIMDLAYHSEQLSRNTVSTEQCSVAQNYLRCVFPPTKYTSVGQARSSRCDLCVRYSAQQAPTPTWGGSVTIRGHGTRCDYH